MGVKKGVRPRYDWTISEILNFTVEFSRTRCRNFSDILKTKSSAEYILEFPGDSKKVTTLIWPAAPPAPAGLVLVFNNLLELFIEGCEVEVTISEVKMLSTSMKS